MCNTPNYEPHSDWLSFVLLKQKQNPVKMWFLK
jgi:hypothetical protein